MQNKVTLFCKVTVKTTDRQQERRFFLHFFRFRKAVIFSKTERKVTGLPACNFLTNSMGIHYLCTRIPTERPAAFRRGRHPEREHRGGAGKEPGRAGANREATGSHREPPGAKPEAPTGRTGKQPEKGRRESRETTGANRRLKKTATDIGKHRDAIRKRRSCSAPGSSTANEQNHTKKSLCLQSG